METGWECTCDSDGSAGEASDGGWPDIDDGDIAGADGLGGAEGPEDQDEWSGVFAAFGDVSSEDPESNPESSEVLAVSAHSDGHTMVALTPQSVLQRLSDGLRDSASNGDALALGRSCSMLEHVSVDAHSRGRKRIFDKALADVAVHMAEDRHVRSVASRATDVNLDPARLATIKKHMASACLLIDRHRLLEMLSRVSEDVLSRGGRCICLTERVRYDETPMALRVATNERSTEDVVGGMTEGSGTVSTENSTAKLVQFEWSGAGLFEIAGRYHFVVFNVPMSLFVVDRTSASMYRHLNSLVSPPWQRIADRFERRQRLVTTDGAPEIMKAERVMHKANPFTASCHTLCSIHRVSAIAKRFGDHVAGDIGLIIHFALSLRPSGAMRRFRKLLRGVLGEWLVVLDGYTHVAADSHRTVVLDLCLPPLPDTPTTIKNRSLVEVLANGNYLAAGRFEHYCRGCCKDIRDTRRKIFEIYVPIVAGRRCPLFPRSRWTRSEATMRWLCLLSLTHGLLQETYQRWAASYGTTLPHGAAAPAAGVPSPAIADELGHETPLLVADDVNEGIAPAPPAQAAQADPDPIATFRAEQANHRMGGLALVSQQSGGARLAILGIVVEAQQSLMRAALTMSGAQWDLDECGKVAIAVEAGLDCVRGVRAVSAAQCVHERAFVSRLKVLLAEPHAWAAIPPSGRIRSFCVLAFRLIVTAGAACHELLVQPRSNYPFIAFAAAAKSPDGLGQLLAKERPCRFDRWTSAFAERFAGRLGTPEARIDCLSTACLLPVDTAGIEARHASVRRRVVLASTHTHLQELSQASADFVLRQHVKVVGQATVAAPVGSGVVAEASAEDQPQPELGDHRGGGGGFRAFISHECRGRERADFGDLARRWKAMPKSAQERYRAIGREATDAHRAGLPSFGVSERDAKRARVKRLRMEKERDAKDEAREAVLREVRPPDVGEEVALAAASGERALVPRFWASWEDAVAHAQARMVTEKLKVSARRAVLSSALATWVSRSGLESEIGGDLRATSDGAACTLSLEPEPSGCPGVRFWKWRPSSTTDTAAKVAAIRGQLPEGRLLHSALDREWAARHTMVTEDCLAPIKERGRLSNPCEVAGICVCSGQGRALRHMVMKLLELTKVLVLADGVLRDALMSCHIGYLVEGRPAVVGAPAAAGQADAPDGPQDACLTRVFVHVAMQYLKPYRPTFAGMDIKALENGTALCTATGDFHTLYTMAQMLDLDAEWSLRVFRLRSTAEPLAVFTPGEMMYDEVPRGAPSNIFWRGPPDSERGRRIRFRGGDGLPHEGTADAPDDGDDGEELVEERNEESDRGTTQSEGSNHGDQHGHDTDAESDIYGDGDVREGNPALLDVGLAAAHGIADDGVFVAAEDGGDAVPEVADPGGGAKSINLTVPHGELRFWPGSRRFGAFCADPRHGRCRREKVCFGGARSTGQGRPLGYLMAWLMAHDVRTGREHMDAGLVIPLSDRQVARAVLAAILGSNILFDRERPKRSAEEPDEPVEHP